MQRFVPDVVGFSLRNIDNVRADGAVPYIAGLRASVERVRAVSAAKVIFGGAGFSVFPQKILELTGADFGIRGEGEIAFPQLLRCVERRGGELRSVPGLLYRTGEGEDVAVHHNPPLNAALSENPAFDRDPAGVAAYRARGAIFNVQTQRGCPLKCCYCT